MFVGVIKADRFERARLRVKEKPFDIPDFEQCFMDLMKESERASVIFSCTYIEETLSNLMKSELNQSQPSIIKSLFSQYGPLSGFKGRLELCLALNWLERSAFDLLENLSQIRNKFAHNRNCTLADEGIANRLQRIIDAMPEGAAKVRAMKKSKYQYLAGSSYVATLMVTCLLYKPAAHKHDVSPSDLVKDGGEDVSPLVIELAQCGARIINACLEWDRTESAKESQPTRPS